MTDCEKPCPYEKEIDMLKKDAESNRSTHEKFYKRFEDIAVEQGKATTRLDVDGMSAKKCVRFLVHSFTRADQ